MLEPIRICGPVVVLQHHGFGAAAVGHETVQEDDAALSRRRSQVVVGQNGAGAAIECGR
jgi:hypothetical protein